MAYPSCYSARMILMKILSKRLRPVPSPSTGKARKRSSPSRSWLLGFFHRFSWFSSIFIVFHSFSPSNSNTTYSISYTYRKISPPPPLPENFADQTPQSNLVEVTSWLLSTYTILLTRFHPVAPGRWGLLVLVLGATRLHVKPESGATRGHEGEFRLISQCNLSPFFRLVGIGRT
jgi:hypothetical protein